MYRAPLLLSLVIVAGAARGQELDRATPDPERRRTVSEREAGAAPVASSTRSVRRAPRVVEEDLDPDLFPDPDAARPGEPEQEGGRIEVDHGGKLWTAGGYDSNVFRSETGHRGDGFGQAHAETNVQLRFPHGGELFAEIGGETLVYFQRDQADEHYVSAFLEYFQVVTSWLEVGAQNAFEYSQLNLLDDRGDLLPRGRFGSVDEEPRLFLILRPGDPERADEGWLRPRDLSLELGASYRLKDYDENTGVDSLDYVEARLDAALRYRLARSPRAQLKLKYRFRRRDYREFRARERDGLVSAASPHLDVERHQLDLRLTQQIEYGYLHGRLIADVGLVYNRDDYRNDRSYREVSGTVSCEWWPVQSYTRVDLGVRGIARDFLVRRPTTTGGHLHHRSLRLQVGVWQRLVSADEGARPGETPVLALFGTAVMTIWRSGDLREDYDRLVVSGGLELSW
ncbi:MAG: hypothetical protein AB7N76_24440 [Planctomycetota bacterium]